MNLALYLPRVRSSEMLGVMALAGADALQRRTRHPRSLGLSEFNHGQFPAIAGKGS